MKARAEHGTKRAFELRDAHFDVPEPHAESATRVMELGVRDRGYVVFGGTRGIGFAAARALVSDGASVALDRSRCTPAAIGGAATWPRPGPGA